MRLRMRAVVTVGCAAALLLNGCTGATSRAVGDGLTMVRAGHSTPLLHPIETAEADALIRGRMGVDAKGCVTIGPDVLIAAPSSRLLDRRTVELLGRAYRIGDVLRGGGGEYRPDSSGAARLAALCGTTSGYAWFDALPDG